MIKSPAVAYCEYKFRTTSRKLLLADIQDSPLRQTEKEFIIDIIEGKQYKELSEKYCKSVSRIGKWKHEVCEILHRYDMRKIMH